MSTKDDKVMRSFDTGATRDTAEGKLDMEGFTHPMVEKQFAKYMNMNRLQSDGQLRDSDNWQKGIPMDAYAKSLRRHHDDVWLHHRGFKDELESGSIIAALCGIIFNAKGYLLEHLKEMDFMLQDFDGCEPTPEMKKRQDSLTPEKEVVTEQKLIEFIDTDVPSNVLRLEKLQSDESVNDAMKVHDDALMEPIVKQLQAWSREIVEDLEDVPELAPCFRCDDPCEDCRDEPECDTYSCGECEFTEECGDISLEDEEDYVDDGDDAPTKCFSCVHHNVLWDMWPCRECRANPGLDHGFTDTYFSEQNLGGR